MPTDYLKKVKRYDDLIRRKQTGSLSELAAKTGMSRRSALLCLSYMKTELNAPIKYNRNRRCYEYTEEGRIEFGWTKGKNPSTDD